MKKKPCEEERKPDKVDGGERKERSKDKSYDKVRHRK